MFDRGSIVLLGSRVGIVAFTGDELRKEQPGCQLEDHTGVWFGSVEEGGPDVRTVPTELLRPGPSPVFKH